MPTTNSWARQTEAGLLGFLGLELRERRKEGNLVCRENRGRRRRRAEEEEETAAEPTAQVPDAGGCGSQVT